MFAVELPATILPLIAIVAARHSASSLLRQPVAFLILVTRDRAEVDLPSQPAEVSKQLLVSRTIDRNGILTQVCGNNFLVLKVAPPLVVLEQQVDEFTGKLEKVVESIHTSATFWSEALGLARRVVSV